MNNTTTKSKRVYRCLSIKRVKKIPSDAIQIHFCNESVDRVFFDFYNFTNNDKVIFLSYNFNDNELVDKFGMLEDYTIENRIEDKDPLNNLEQYRDEKYNYYEILIEGIDYSYIDQNFDDILRNFREVRNTTVKYHWNIVNIPLDKLEEFQNKISPLLPRKKRTRKWNDL